MSKAWHQGNHVVKMYVYTCTDKFFSIDDDSPCRLIRYLERLKLNVKAQLGQLKTRSTIKNTMLSRIKRRPVFQYSLFCTSFCKRQKNSNTKISTIVVFQRVWQSWWGEKSNTKNVWPFHSQIGLFNSAAPSEKAQNHTLKPP